MVRFVRSICFLREAEVNDWVAVVLAAGLGTRMKSKRPKVLHRICGRAMGAYVAGTVAEAGISRITIVVGNGASEVRSALGEGFTYAEQPEQLGTGHALAQARTLLKDAAPNVLVVNGDVPLVRPESLVALATCHLAVGAVATILTNTGGPVEGLGRVVRDDHGRPKAIVEQAELPKELRSVDEINVGAYCFGAAWLWAALGELRPGKRGETYLTDLIKLAYDSGKATASMSVADPEEALGVDDRLLLAEAEAAVRRRIRRRWMMEGVTILDPPSTYIDADARVGRDSIIHPNSSILGASTVGEDCEIGPGSIIENSTVGSRVRVLASVVEDSTIEEDVDVGPYSHLRGGAYIEAGAHLGNFVEVKKSRFERGAVASHFSYIGDAAVGKRANIGAGTITCNYDGVRKHPTVIGEGALIGSDTMLVAPVKVGAGAKTGAGAVVTQDVAPGATVVGVPARTIPTKPLISRDPRKTGARTKEKRKR
jgi:bifunctional UDP-N-acetylglucosamine pyrophosphorylase/glucosamine-1-phosphate N-acetyltransferase